MSGFSSGVSDGYGQSLDDGYGVDRVLVRGGDAGRRQDSSMKGEHGHGQVIDLEDYRNRRALREWAVANGFGVRNGKVT